MCKNVAVRWKAGRVGIDAFFVTNNVVRQRSSCSLSFCAAVGFSADTKNECNSAWGSELKAIDQGSQFLE